MRTRRQRYGEVVGWGRGGPAFGSDYVVAIRRHEVWKAARIASLNVNLKVFFLSLRLQDVLVGITRKYKQGRNGLRWERGDARPNIFIGSTEYAAKGRQLENEDNLAKTMHIPKDLENLIKLRTPWKQRPANAHLGKDSAY